MWPRRSSLCLSREPVIERLMHLVMAAVAAWMHPPVPPTLVGWSSPTTHASRSRAPQTTTTTTAAPVAPVPVSGAFLSAQASWYGPGLYGNGTACGQRYTEQIEGVAHKTLPCGTMVTFRHNGREVTVPVIDRGPFTKGRMWDLSAATCRALGHCFTGQIEYRIA